MHSKTGPAIRVCRFLYPANHPRSLPLQDVHRYGPDRHPGFASERTESLPQTKLARIISLRAILAGSCRWKTHYAIFGQGWTKSQSAEGIADAVTYRTS